MKKVFVDAHNIVSPIGNTSSENFVQLKNGSSGVRLQTRPDIDNVSFWASLINNEQLELLSAGLNQGENYTRFEKLLIISIKDSLTASSFDVTSPKTVFIFSTTKGNISLLEQSNGTSKPDERLNLYYSAKTVADYFKNPNLPIVISNACISGSVAILHAKRLLETGQYENAVITGADTVSRFVFSGFKSFQALSAGRCMPFSSSRDGINLGEAGATLLLTTVPTSAPSIKIQVTGGAICNDANHISGPSRTGQELSTAIDRAINASEISHKEIDFISAHGTATPFNDEMEAKAFNLSGLQEVPVNSLKGYFGHTLGAAGIVESIISIISLKEEIILPIIEFQGPSVFPGINVCAKTIKKTMNHFLKTASGFGGCNAALVFSKS